MASSARIDELRKKFDENPRRYFAPLANEYRKSGDLEQAIFICQEYLPQQPGHMSGHIVYGQALFELSRFDEARAVFETALTLDPENLIALRHLGDIARQADDIHGARAWYQRVLEADPRNEEIAEIMSTVLLTPADGQLVVPSEVDVVLVEEAAAPVAEVEVIAPPEPEPEPVAEPEIRRSREALSDDELFDLNDFSVGDIPMSSLGAIVVEAPSAAQSYAAAEPPAIDDFVEQPVEELAADVTLGLPDDGDATNLSDAAADAVLDGLQSFGEGSPLGFSDEPSPVIEVESFFEVPPTSPIAFEVVSTEPTWNEGSDAGTFDVPAEPVEAAEPMASVEPETFSTDGEDERNAVTAEYPTPVTNDAWVEEAVPAEAFVTETMAELYLQQGHLEAALDIYQKLAEQRPDDEQLRQRLDAISDSIRAQAAPEPVEPAFEDAPMESVAEALSGGPTIREFLSVLFRAQAAPAGGAEAIPSDVDSIVDSIPVAFDEAQFSAAAEPAFDEPIFGVVAEPISDEPNFDDLTLGGSSSSESAFDVETSSVEMPTFESAFDLGEEPAEEFAPEVGAWAESEPEPEIEFPVVAEEAAFVDTGFESIEDAGADFASGFDTDTSIPDETEAPTPVMSARPTPSSSATVSGSIDALFSGAQASESDAEAASTLAQAFAPESQEPEAPLQGLPARRASGELSLDHVFKSSPASRGDSEGDGFSFDQFFADDVADAPHNSGAEPPLSAGPGGGGDDIAQFNSWLNGLKKT